MNSVKRFLNDFFKIEERGSTISQELLGGLVVFLAMIYILPVNSFMLGNLEGSSVGSVFLATALSAGVATLIMGLLANLPVGLAPGMGVNAFFTYTVVMQIGFSYGEALVCVFLSGIIFFIVSITNLRQAILKAIPKSLKCAVGAGIGGFIAFIGLKNAGIIVANPATFVGFQSFLDKNGSFSLEIFTLVSLAFIGIILVLILGNLKNKRISRFAVIISMLVVAIISGILNLSGLNTPGFMGSSLDDLSLNTSIWSGFSELFTNPAHLALLFPIVFSFLFVDFFDTAGTLVAVGNSANLIKEDGSLIGDKKALMADSIGTLFGACVGTSTVTSFVESTTGVESGSRTGLSATVVGVLFLLSLVAYPIFSVFGSVTIDGASYSPVTSLALVYVGILMFKQVFDINKDDIAEVAATFITIMGMILCYSISYGIAFGFLTYILVMLATRRHKEVSITMYALGVVFISYIILDMLI